MLGEVSIVYRKNFFLNDRKKDPRLNLRRGIPHGNFQSLADPQDLFLFEVVRLKNALNTCPVSERDQR